MSSKLSRCFYAHKTNEIIEIINGMKRTLAHSLSAFMSLPTESLPCQLWVKGPSHYTLYLAHHSLTLLPVYVGVFPTQCNTCPAGRNNACHIHTTQWLTLHGCSIVAGWINNKGCCLTGSMRQFAPVGNSSTMWPLQRQKQLVNDTDMAWLSSEMKKIFHSQKPRRDGLFTLP